MDVKERENWSITFLGEGFESEYFKQFFDQWDEENHHQHKRKHVTLARKYHCTECVYIIFLLKFE